MKDHEDTREDVQYRRDPDQEADYPLEECMQSDEDTAHNHQDQRRPLLSTTPYFTMIDTLESTDDGGSA